MNTNDRTNQKWIKIAPSDAFLKNGGGCVKVGDLQIAVFNFDRENWYAVQNLCPHDNRMVLSRGLLGDKDGKPKVACPLHKNQFCLTDGKHLGGQDWTLQTYLIKEEKGFIYLALESKTAGVSNGETV
jgi:nitrite reductase (NADH) small subunit